MESDSELPSEIIGFQILSRISAKSLMRFKSVCKSWSSLIRNPSFVNAHQKFYRNKHSHLLLTTWDESARQQHFFSVKINQEGSPTLVTHLLKLPTPPGKNVERLYEALSINGLVCLYLSDSLFPNQTDHNHPVRIFNPCTRECIVLPHDSPAYRTIHVTHHFGFSSHTNEYKVLQVKRFQPLNSTRDMSFMVKIFKLGTSSWRRIEADINDLPFDPLKCQFERRSVCVHGAIHWMHDSTQNIIAVFDLKDERFRAIPLPEDYDYRIHGINDKLGNIFEMEGCLALIGDKQLRQMNTMELWILKDYQNQVWVKETITFPFSWTELGYPVPFYTIHTSELLLLQSSRLLRQDSSEARVLFYNLKSRSFRSECVFPESILPNDVRLKLLAHYDDSIVPLRLPSKSLMQFCVCKSWSSLTRIPSFLLTLITTWASTITLTSFSRPGTNPQGSTLLLTN
ncbi:unnamed protein product [Malus baccata var. baccata]